ncbi:hypothetical protein J5N97_016792 [Dioscorea zingiberensis]|uniref:Uncharacterized protein n=1 Tax=Dioscorea zingiberensis TaxID=325984 RepID=A0A9D5CKL9_9LILI|nr:hypothetical protein J5N97_016792 [Dioscorea zingiberensis]
MRAQTSAAPSLVQPPSFPSLPHFGEPDAGERIAQPLTRRVGEHAGDSGQAKIAKDLMCTRLSVPIDGSDIAEEDRISCI